MGIFWLIPQLKSWPLYLIIPNIVYHCIYLNIQQELEANNFAIQKKGTAQDFLNFYAAYPRKSQTLSEWVYKIPKYAADFWRTRHGPAWWEEKKGIEYAMQNNIPLTNIESFDWKDCNFLNGHNKPTGQKINEL